MINYTKYFLAFLVGCFCSYISLQFSLFDVKTELDVPNIILSLIGIAIGIIIANTIQQNVNKAQNKYVYLVGKVDLMWMNFNSFCRGVEANKSVSSAQIQGFNSDVIYDIEFVKQLFEAYGRDRECLDALEISLINIEELLTNLPAKNNSISFPKLPTELKQLFNKADKCFAVVLKSIE